jgi:hypothetical protein
MIMTLLLRMLAMLLFMVLAGALTTCFVVTMAS